MEFGLILGCCGLAISILGSVLTNAVMFGGMKADMASLKVSMAMLSEQQNNHLQYHLQRKD